MSYRLTVSPPQLSKNELKLFLDCPRMYRFEDLG